MQLIEPTMEFKQSWEEAMQEFRKEGMSGFWNMDGELFDLVSYIDRTRNEAKGINLKEGRVPCSTFWLIDGGEFKAHINIRHELNEYLRKRGGHIGYYVRPSARGQGYGTAMLELTLKKCREIGLERVMLTCDVDNIGSYKVIEKNGGVLEEEVEVDGELIKRYWIEL